MSNFSTFPLQKPRSWQDELREQQVSEAVDAVAAAGFPTDDPDAPWAMVTHFETTDDHQKGIEVYRLGQEVIKVTTLFTGGEGEYFRRDTDISYNGQNAVSRTVSGEKGGSAIEQRFSADEYEYQFDEVDDLLRAAFESLNDTYRAITTDEKYIPTEAEKAEMDKDGREIVAKLDEM